MLLPYLEKVGRQLDVLINVSFTNGAEGQTLSRHSAEVAAAGGTWGCVLCSILSVLVERGHCKKVLSGAAESTLAMLRAGLAILGFLILLLGLGHLIWGAVILAAGSAAALV